MEPMIEQTLGFKAIASIAAKPLLAALIAWGWWPTADFMILQVDSHVLLNPTWKVILEESKIILGVIIAFLVILKIVIGIVRYKKEK